MDKFANIDNERLLHGEKVRAKIYKYIVSYISKNLYAPTIREIASAVGLSSTSSVQNHLTRMFAAGVLEGDQHSSRAIRVPGYKFVKCTTTSEI